MIRAWGASMGPHADERGRVARHVRGGADRRLQWGRVLMNAEGRRRQRYGREFARLQWGRVLMNAEGTTPNVALAQIADASMGPRSDERGRYARSRRTPADPRSASMGPRSDERGREISRDCMAAQLLMLQWGRVLMSAEGATSRSDGPRRITDASMGPRSDERGRATATAWTSHR